ncbi:hypothetical protein S7335_1478 [Synechococcus sp. PCC 7335]|nr:hypothetical protein S7335_1478 [Synechococcus sp. PCC 7335]
MGYVHSKLELSAEGSYLARFTTLTVNCEMRMKQKLTL